MNTGSHFYVNDVMMHVFLEILFVLQVLLFAMLESRVKELAESRYN
jgi:hypothetical protein